MKIWNCNLYFLPTFLLFLHKSTTDNGESQKMSLHLSNLAKLRTRQSREAVRADPVVPHVVLRLLLLLLVVLLPHQMLLLMLRLPDGNI